MHCIARTFITSPTSMACGDTTGGLVEGCHEGMGLVIFEAPKGRSQATHGDGFEGHLGDPGVLGDRTTGREGRCHGLIDVWKHPETMDFSCFVFTEPEQKMF